MKALIRSRSDRGIVMSDGVFADPGVRSAHHPILLTHDEWSRLRARLSLSRREAEVVRCLLDGHTEGEVAALLRLSPHTVHSYVGRAYRRLGVGSRADMVCAVFRAFVRLHADQAPPRESAAVTSPVSPD